MQYGWLSIALKFPRKHSGVIFVVAQRFAFRCLMFLAKMCAGRFVALECVDAHQLGEFHEIGNASSTFQGLIEIIAFAGHACLVPELFSQFRDFFKRLAQSLFVTQHSAFVPENQTQFAMERVNGTSAVDVEELLYPCAHTFLYCLKLWTIWRRPFSHLAGQVI